MLFTLTTPKTLPPSIHSLSSHRCSRKSHALARPCLAVCLHSERGVEFEIGDAFYREESKTGRDLGVLSASIYKRENSHLRVLDAMCGSGIRSCRYLVQSNADFVLANDANEDARSLIVENLERTESNRWSVSHNEANRLLSECYLERNYFDLIDIDSFGSESMFLRSAMLAVKLGGLLYLTHTDGYSSGGHRPYHSLAAFGSFVRPMPYSNEVGLRMLIGGAIREASVLGFRIAPLFSYYSYHGPVFRVMMRLLRGKLPEDRQYGFIGYCHCCGSSQTFTWPEVGKISCLCSKPSVTVSGPLYTGPLHNGEYVRGMLKVAEEWGWAEEGSEIEKLLKVLIEESDERLPSGYIKVDEVAKRGRVNSPPMKGFMSAIMKEGYAVSRSHIAFNAIKTNCPMAQCIAIAQNLQVNSS